MNEIATLPPDLVVGEEWKAQTRPVPWSIPPDKFEKIWQKATGKHVVVAVLDTGYKPHPDLPEPIVSRNFTTSRDVVDRHGHQTHCNGTSVGRNGIGVAPEADLIVGKVLGDNGSGPGGANGSIRWAVDEGADVVSMSLSGGSPSSRTQRDIQYALSKGCIVNCAAGNSGFNGIRNTIGYPAKFSESLCNGATKENGDIAGFSSGGREMDWASPGKNIISCNLNGGYTTMSGTSMATPFGSGLLALIIQLIRQKGNAQFTSIEAWREFLKRWTEDKGQQGRDPVFGFGVPRASEIIEELAKDDLGWL